ncbi:MAG: multicopper oxidase family protein [Desulfobaccales bacterium]
MMNRRRFLKLLGMAGAAAAIPWKFDLRQGFSSSRAYAFAQSPILRKFVDSLPGLTAAGANNLGQYLTVLTPNTTAFPGSDYYKVVASQFTQKAHSQLPATTFWGYAQDGGPGDLAKKYLGGVIVATANRPVRLTMRNNLPDDHILPVDKTLTMWNGAMGAATGVNRMSTHLHGGFPPWISDGTPFQDFDPNGGYGFSAGFPPDMPASTITPPGSYSYYWTNQQIAKFMWYHDHAMDITRLNAYAGLATGYVLTDANEQNLINGGLLPPPAQTIYLVLQDKTFKEDGSLWYPFQYEENPPYGGTSGRVDWSGPPASDPAVGLNTLANPSLVPEAFLDTTIINGCCYPYLEVQRQQYRFRILNGAQARFYNLQLYYAQSNNLDSPLSGEPNLNAPGPRFTQIGTEGGFLPAPVALPSNPSGPGVTQQQLVYDPLTGNALYYNLLLAPAERCDLLIDFSGAPLGSKLILYSDSPAPFPGGDPRNDYYTGDPNYTTPAGNPEGLSGGAPSTRAGFGPNVRTMMQFRVVPNPPIDTSKTLNTLQEIALKNLDSAIFPPIEPLPQQGARVRRLTLNETFETPDTSGNPYYGRLIQILGTDVVQGVDIWGAPIFYQSYQSGRGDVVTKGAVEIWEILNLTGDTHPIHFHLINCQVLTRQAFDATGYMAAGAAAAPGTKVDVTPFLLGSPRPPDRNETGWKETVRMNPGEVTRVIAKFDLPKLPWPVPISTRLSDPMNPPGPNNPRINGYEYVWHCHILEHEEHDMMRALVVVGPDITGARSLLL